MDYYLGIDGGGTKTRAIIADALGRIVGRGEAGPANYHNVGIKVVEKNLKEATRKAWKASGLYARPARAAFLGVAGVKSMLDQSRIQGAAERIQLAEVESIQVENDLWNALAGGLAGKPGIALIAGTGSNAFGRDSRNQTKMCGGWGWILDDEGGAFGLSLEAMRQSTRSSDGQLPSTTMLPSLLAFLGLQEPNEILERLYVQSWTPDYIAQFAQVVMQEAKQGDSLALSVLKKGAKRLASQVAHLGETLKFRSKSIPVVLLGGCLENDAIYRRLVIQALQTHSPYFKIVPPHYSTEQGAIINVLQRAKIRWNLAVKIK